MFYVRKGQIVQDSDSFDLRKFKKKICSMIECCDENKASSVGDVLFNEILLYRGNGYLSSINDFISVVSLLDIELFNKFGRSVANIGNYEGFYLCKCAKAGFFGGDVIGSCAVCIYMVSCSRLLSINDLSEINSLESMFIVLSE